MTELSLIVCSRTAALPPALQANIVSTIGNIDYELVVIDNSTNRYTIAQAYNLGVSRATGRILCFMHDDIEYRTAGWGGQVLRVFSDPQVMACSNTGCPYTRRVASYHGIVYLHFVTAWGGVVGDCANDGKPVVVFDGMWFCIRKSCFDTIRFDESYPGFHLYDMDIAMQLYSNGMKTVFTSAVLLQHKMDGDDYVRDGVFIENLFQFYRKWHHLFPAIVDPDALPTPDDAYEFELEALYTSLKHIVVSKRFHLLPQWCRMIYDVLHKPLVVAIPEIMNHHRHLLRWKREAKKQLQ